MSRYPLAMRHPATGLQFAFSATDEQRMSVGGWTVDAPPVVAAVASVPPPEATEPAGASPTTTAEHSQEPAENRQKTGEKPEVPPIKRKPGRPRKVL